MFLIGCFLAPHFSAQRLILPELVGDDEQTVAQANAFVEGAQRTTALVGPALAGVLIPFFGAPNVLYIDAATFLFSFLTLALFVPYRPPLPVGDEGRGVLSGVRFLLRDPLMRRLLADGARAQRARPADGALAAGARVRGVRRQLARGRRLLRSVRRRARSSAASSP